MFWNTCMQLIQHNLEVYAGFLLLFPLVTYARCLLNWPWALLHWTLLIFNNLTYSVTTQNQCNVSHPGGTVVYEAVNLVAATSLENQASQLAQLLHKLLYLARRLSASSLSLIVIFCTICSRDGCHSFSSVIISSSCEWLGQSFAGSIPEAAPYRPKSLRSYLAVFCHTGVLSLCLSGIYGSFTFTFESFAW